MVDGLGLASSQLFPKVPSDEAVSKSVDGSFGRDVLRCVAQAEPS
jgi:glutathione synthase/RimK-type ligase-like ATP-grasp enzyme